MKFYDGIQHRLFVNIREKTVKIQGDEKMYMRISDYFRNCEFYLYKKSHRLLLDILTKMLPIYVA